jgi:hypothetical protein
MIGRSALWVARQHGHSIATMLRAYAAWAEGAIEADLEAIRRAMGFGPHAIRPITRAIPAIKEPKDDLALDLALADGPAVLSARNECGRSGGERGIRIQTHCRISNLRIRKTTSSPTIP